MLRNENLLMDFLNTHQGFIAKEAYCCMDKNGCSYEEMEDILQELRLVACSASRRCNGSRKSNLAYLRQAVKNRAINLSKRFARRQAYQSGAEVAWFPQDAFGNDPFGDVEARFDWELEAPQSYQITCLLAEGLSPSDIEALGVASRDKVRRVRRDWVNRHNHNNRVCQA